MADPIDAEDSTRITAGDLFDMANPQEKYKRLIEEEDGMVKPFDGFTVVFSREMCERVLRDPETFSSVVDMNLGNARPMIPLNVDPPKHSRYRKILDPLFAPRRMDEQQEDITRRVNELIDTFVDRGECNFTEEVAEILPSSVFLGLMGFPQEELKTLLRLRDGIMRPFVLDPAAATDPITAASVREATGRDVYAYFGAALEERRAHPREDILTHFVTTTIDGERLSQDELLDICFLFLIAGLDTVSDALTCFFAFLATHPDHRRRLVDDPAVTGNAVEELLRWESPVHTSPQRLVTSDTVLPNGCPVSAGSFVMASYGGANIDPNEFPDPMDVDFDRPKNRHYAFGAGVHRCLGSHLARRELRVTLEEWHRRIPEYRLKPGHEVLEYPYGLRSVKDLMLTWS